MGTVPLMRYWPYDEVTAIGDRSSGRFIFSTPWLNVETEVAQEDVPRAAAIVEKLSSASLGPHDLMDIYWLFSSLAQHSLSYILPRPEFNSATDQHRLMGKSFYSLPPRTLLMELSHRVEGSSRQFCAFEQLVRDPQTLSEWKWDAEAALSFSAVPGGHDPMSLFSVARRFHLLESVENNKTEELFRFIREFRSDSEKYRDAAAQVVRQNHYITQKCEAALSPALQIALHAEAQVRKFIRAEAGHDVLLDRSMRALGIPDPETVPVIDPVLVLMEVFRITAQRNFLAFSMVVDMFERSSYQDQDPLAALLIDNGHTEAAKQIDLHREINDSGGHENVGLSFLERMSPVDADYSREALHLAELVTHLLHGISSTLLEGLKH